MSRATGLPIVASRLLSPSQRAVLVVLREHDATACVVADALESTDDRARVVLHELREAGFAVVVGTQGQGGRQGKPASVWQVTPSGRRALAQMERA